MQRGNESLGSNDDATCSQNKQVDPSEHRDHTRRRTNAIAEDYYLF
jgi:hypothetical protein